MLLLLCIVKAGFRYRELWFRRSTVYFVFYRFVYVSNMHENRVFKIHFILYYDVIELLIFIYSSIFILRKRTHQNFINNYLFIILFTLLFMYFVLYFYDIEVLLFILVSFILIYIYFKKTYCDKFDQIINYLLSYLPFYFYGIY